MAFWINITPEVVKGMESFGFQDPPPDKILEFVERYLSQYGEACSANRWDQCPDRFFVYSHVLVHGGQFHTLEFVVEDASKAVGVLHVVWVEHYPGDAL